MQLLITELFILQDFVILTFNWDTALGAINVLTEEQNINSELNIFKDSKNVKFRFLHYTLNKLKDF